MNSPNRRRWLPSPAMAVAIVAMVLALGGTATALSGKFSVKRDDIAPKAVNGSKLAGQAVTTGKIKDRSVGSYKLNTSATSVVLGESSTTSQTPVDLGGPSVSVKVPEGALIAIQAEAAIRATGNAQGRVYLHEPTLVPTPAKILGSGSTADFQTKYSTPGTPASGADEGVGNRVRAGWIVMASTPGTKTFSLRYDTSAGTAIFKSRRLTATVIR